LHPLPLPVFQHQSNRRHPTLPEKELESDLPPSRNPECQRGLVSASKTDRGIGFTLLELLIVLLIVAFVGVIVLRPEWRRTDAAELKSAALTFASDLRSARSWAITHNAVVVVQLDLDHGKYSGIGVGRVTVLLRAMTLGARLEDDAATRSSGVVGLRFWPDGTVTGADLLLALHGQTRHVTIDWLTGHVATSP
jgi:general secretion pathway protein H